ncbi:MAG: hypothetical protein KGH66_03645 [Candidatus Micrarchaeota archaeon]|nr:hypothetical protein [Candidatus Micrarchaeota archaeon]
MASRLLTINIRKYLANQPTTRRRNKAVKYIRDRIGHYTKTKVENVKISQELNALIFKYYSKKMVPVKVNVNIDNGMATATPFQDKKAEAKAVEKAAPAKKEAEKKTAATKASAAKPAAQPSKEQGK